MRLEDAFTRETFITTPSSSSATRHAAAGLFRPRGDNSIPATLWPLHHPPSVAPYLKFEPPRSVSSLRHRCNNKRKIVAARTKYEKLEEHMKEAITSLSSKSDRGTEVPS
ncbi:uncharacterized protein DS421_18g613480 [Arachis hypogaea]|nr:uncharacterized protein DS421_18g613480 [Arachis hypogaea]